VIPAVLHVAQPVSEGVARCVADLVADQVARGWRVTVACPSDGWLHDEIERLGAAHEHWLAWRPPGPHVVGEAWRLHRILRAIDPNLVHLHSSKAGLAGRLALRGRKTTLFEPNAWSFEAADGLVRRAAIAWERLGARWAHALVCVSDAERQRGVDVGISANWQVVPNGVDVEAYAEATDEDRRATRGRLGLADGPLVVCVGRLSRQKGQDVLLAAWPSVRARVPEGRLALVGAGDEEDALRAQADDSVHFAGQRDDVKDWLAAADVVVLPSRWEGMSIGLLEALASGRSVVATDAAGSREAIGDEAGAIVATEDPPALAEELARRLLDPELAAAEGKAGRRRAETLFDVRKRTGRIAELYDLLLN